MGHGKTRAYKHRLDKYYHLARQTGYRSRAAFKLIQLNQDYHFLNDAHVCLDLCAAPGGWSQVAAKYMPVGSQIIAIDLAPIRDIPRVTAIQGDILLPKTHARVRKLIQGQKADVVLNDGAPNVGAAWVTDSSNQLELCLASVKFATIFLRKGGAFVTKVFRSEHYNSLLYVLEKFFNRVIPTKPKASRDSSAELFVVALDYKAPDHVDQRLLDPTFVFSDTDELMKTHSTAAELEKKMTAIEYSTVSVADFLKAPKPVDILNSANKLSFSEDPLSQAALNHPATTQEIKILCEDLKVVGFSDRKVLLKWRNKLRNALVKAEEQEEADEAEEEKKEGEEEEDDEETRAALKELKAKRRKEEKAARRRAAKMRDQLIKRLQKNQGAQNAEIADPALRYGKLETPVVPEEPKTFEEKVEENIERYALNNKGARYDDEEEFVGPAPKLARYVEIDESKIQPDEETKSREARIWYNQDIFGDSDAGYDDDYSDEEEEESGEEGSAAGDEEEEASEAEQGSGEDEEKEQASEQKSAEKEKAENAAAQLLGQSKKDFDITAFKYARIASTKHGKRELVDASFNRYNFGDGQYAPEWFLDDEEKFNRPMLPHSKDDIAAYKEQMKEINETDPKRVLEARARKRAKAYQKMKAAQEKVDEIAEKEGLNERSKLRLMERISEKAMKQLKPAPTVVVTQKRDQGKPSIPKRAKGSKVLLVDARSKKDLRAKKFAEKRPAHIQHKKKSKYIHRRK